MEFSGVLTAKLKPPAPVYAAVKRIRLLKRLKSGSQGLALVWAPAGFGKTSLLVQLAAMAPTVTCWLRLDEGDNDLRVFMLHLTASLHSRWPEVGLVAASYLKAGTLPAGQASAVVSSLLNDLAEHVQGRAHVVLDGFEVIWEPQVVACVQRLAEYAPQGTTIVVAGRTRPNLGSTRLKAHGELLELGPQDLRFDREETIAMFRKLHGARAHAAVAENIQEMTGGWPAVVRLVGDSGLRETFAYIREEVLDKVDDDIRAFMRMTSVLNNLKPAVCSMVSGMSDCRGTLEELASRGFIYRGASGNYLWQPIIRLSFASELGEARGGLLLLAGNAETAGGDPLEGIGYLVEAGDFAGAAKAIAAHAEALVDGDAWASLELWFEAIPLEVLMEHPEALAARAALAFTRGDMGLAQALLGDAASTVPGVANTYRARLRLAQGDTRGAVACADLTKLPVREWRDWLTYTVHAEGSGRALSLLNRAAKAPPLKAGSRMAQELALCQCDAYALAGELKAVLKVVREHPQLWSGRRAAGLLRPGLAALALSASGEVGEAVRIAEGSVAALESEGNGCDLPWANAVLSWVYQMADDGGKAVSAATTAVALAEEMGLKDNKYALASCALAACRARQGRAAEALALAESCMRIADDLPHPWPSAIKVAVGWVMLLLERAEAIPVLEASLEEAGRHGARLVEAWASIGLGAAKLAANDVPGAEANALRYIALEGTMGYRLHHYCPTAEFRSMMESCKRLRKAQVGSPAPGSEPTAMEAAPLFLVSVLGTFSVAGPAPARTAVRFPTKKAKALVAALVHLGGQPVAKHELCKMLWPALPLKDSFDLFHITAHRARRALSASSGRPDLIVYENGMYHLRMEEFRVLQPECASDVAPEEYMSDVDLGWARLVGVGEVHDVLQTKAVEPQVC